MDNLQKKQIILLRRSGESYSKIADALGISINTVKSFCHRNNLAGGQVFQAHAMFCPQCGAKLQQITGRKKKNFCSDKCRMAWWNSHPEKMNRKKPVSLPARTGARIFSAMVNGSARIKA